MKYFLFFLLMLSFGCEKNTNRDLMNDQGVLAQKIEKSTGFSIQSIELVSDFSCKFGLYKIIEFTDKNNVHRNLVMSNFAIDLVSNQIRYVDKSNTVDERTPGWCFEYWCTSSGNCSECQVTLSNPSNPVLKCSCSACHLNVKRYECSNE